MKIVMLVAMLLACAGCDNYRVEVSALCNDAVEVGRFIYVEELSDAEIAVMVAREQAKLCVNHDGVFHMKAVKTW